MNPLEIATTLALAAGRLLRDRLNDPRDIQEKRSRDLVTDSDRASEALIVERLHELRPDSSILGEESGVTAGTNDERWIIDPLDGTTNYAHRYPLFCVSIACEQAGRIVAGAIYAPMLDEMYAAALGAGATCNGASIRVSSISQVREALICTGFMPGRDDGNLDNFKRASLEAQAIRRDGTAALDLAFVAHGRYDAFWEFDLKPWDVAAGSILVTEAGGSIRTIGGGEWNVDAPSVLADNGKLGHTLTTLLFDRP